MELRSRRLGSDQIDSADRKGKKPMVMEEMDTDGKSDNYTDEEYRGGESSKSDSDYEAEDIGGNFPDLNLDPTVSISSSDGEDDDYDDLSDSRRRKAQSKKRGRKSTTEIEIALGLQDALHTMGLSEEVPFDLPMVKKMEKAKKAKKPALLWQAWEEEHERWIDENLLEDVNLDQSEVMNETAEPSSDLKVPLFRYQKEWLAWALKKESSVTRGGILADEMGMGKTIQAISLVLAKRELLQMSCEPDEHSHSPGSSKVLPMIKGTLVICPLVAVSQWEKEINKFTVEGSTKVLVYHGPKREKSVEQLSEYDFVITTYATIESEYRKHVMPPKEKCPYCGKSFYKNKLTIHLKYHCGPDAIKTEKQSKQSKKKKGGQSSKMDLERGSIKKKKEEMCLSVEGIQNSFMHAIKWQRIILDEAHFIKSRHCNTTKAVFALESSYKWALSGTPIQNRVGELYSLVRFLQIVPFSYNLCKDCDCRILDHKYSSSNKCLNCNHSSVRHFCWWNKNIATPIQSHGYGNRGKRAMILLKNKILKSIVLRRTKLDRADELGLPPRIVSLRRDSLDITEQDYYESLYNESRSQFNTYVAANTLTSNYAHIFDLLTRLRQAVDHPYLVVYSPTAAPLKGENLASNGEQACGLCHEELDDPVVTSCEHTFCKGCLIKHSASLERASCPSCSKLLTVDLTSINHAEVNKTTIKGFRSSSIVNRIQIENFQTSTKIEALREEIRFMIERDGSAKAIVFSQFTSFLDLINYSLQMSGVSCVQLIGSMSLDARNAAIKKFTDDPDCKIFLMSLKAGGVALNLTVASHVFLMDPWWNPAVERQAQDRIHRIGQFKPIRIVRFVIENTIEERILKLQEKKQILFEGTIGGSSEALGKLTEADLRFLFVT